MPNQIYSYLAMQPMTDPFQGLLWSVDAIKRFHRRIKKPRNPVGLIVAELDAMTNIQLIMEEVGLPADPDKEKRI